MTPKTYQFACCFCMEGGEFAGDEPIEVKLAGQQDKGYQTFWAHLQCLRRAIHPNAQLEVPFGPEWDYDEDEDADEVVDGDEWKYR